MVALDTPGTSIAWGDGHGEGCGYYVVEWVVEMLLLPLLLLLLCCLLCCACFVGYVRVELQSVFSEGLVHVLYLSEASVTVSGLWRLQQQLGANCGSAHKAHIDQHIPVITHIKTGTRHPSPGRRTGALALGG